MKTVSVIRDRGQLTIPGSIRRFVSWVNPMSAVTVTVVTLDKIVITPHLPSRNWDDIWGKINESRAIQGKGRQSAVKVLERDRNSH